ncbi:centromere protein F-like isoform X2 [Montipora capricornis]|uniref:centromere protein F-like isoform X2 n=1 Tax=Montipora capricornis TaxID=246305 RepID=UPI0035F2097A
MSWAKEEWKQELSANALKKVYDLEQRCETLQKDVRQKQFQLDSSQAALAKQKKLTEEEKANAGLLKKESHSLGESIQELERSREKILHDLHAKEGQIRCLDGKMNRTQQQLDSELAKAVQLKNELDHLLFENNQNVAKLEKQSADFNRAKEANSLLQRQLGGHKDLVRALESQLKTLGEEPNSRAKKSSSGSDSEVDWQCGVDSKLREAETNLQMEKEQREKIEKELQDLKAVAAQFRKNEEANGTLSVKELAINQQIDLASSDEDQLQKKIKELATVKEILAQKEAELQLKNKEFSNMSECLQKKDKELSELKLSTSDIHTIKSALDEANVNLAALEKKAKQRELDMECQRHNSEAVIKGMDEKMKEKEKEHRQEMYSQSQAITALEKQCADLDKKSSTLQNKFENSQKLIEAKKQDIARLKANLKEVENSRQQHSSHLDSKMSELEQKFKQEEEKCVGMKRELDASNAVIFERENKIADLNRQLEKLGFDIQEKEKDLSLKEQQIQQSHGEDNRKLATAMENIALLERQKTELEEANQKALAKLSDEAAGTMKELQAANQEITKLKEQNVHLENLIASKRKEYQATEDSRKDLCEKLQMLDMDLANKQKEWATEKAALAEKERCFQSTLEAMKNDSKALQHDYKKACELADMKSAETRDVIDKLESSQKHAHELQQRLSRTEAALKEKESGMDALKDENNRLSIEKEAKEYEVEKNRNELSQLNDKRKADIEKLSEVAESANMRLEACKLDCNTKEKEIENLSVKLQSAKLECDGLKTSLKTFEEKLINSKEMLQLKEAGIKEASLELESKEKLLGQMQHKLDETSTTANKLEQSLRRLEMQREEDLNLIENKDGEISSFEKELNDIRAVTESELSKMKEECNARQNEFVFLQEKLDSVETLLGNKEVELTAVSQELKKSNKELVDLQQRFTSQEELSCKQEGENARLSIELEQKSAVLDARKRELDETQDKLKDLEAEHVSVLEKYSELSLLKNQEVELRQRLEQAKAVAETKTEELKITMIKLEASEGERSELSSMLDELCNTNFKLEDQLKEKAAQLKEAIAEIKRKEEEICNHNKVIKKMETTSAEEMIEIKEQCILLESQVSNLQEKCSQFETCNERKDEELMRGKGKIAELNNEICKLQDEIASKMDLIERLEKESVALTGNLQHKTKAFENKESELKELSRTLMELKANGQSAQEAAITEMESLKKEVSSLREKLDQANVANEMKEQDVEGMNELLQAAEKDKHILGAEVDEQRDKNVAFGVEIAELRKRLDLVSEVVKTKDEELLNQGAIIKQLEKDRDEENTKNNTHCIQLESQLSALQEKCGLLEACNLKKEEEISSSTNRIQESTSEIYKLQNDLASKEELIEKIEKEKVELTESLRYKITALENKERELSDVSEKLEELTSSEQSRHEVKLNDIENLKKEVASLTEKLSRANVANEMREQDVESMNEILETVEDEKRKLGAQMEELFGIKEELENQTVDLRHDFEKQGECLEEKERSLRELRDRLEEEKKNVQMAVECYENEVSPLKNEVVSLKEKMEKLNAVVETKNQEVQSKDHQLEVAKEENSLLMAKVDELATQCKVIEERNAQTEHQIEQLSSMVKSKDKEIEEKSEMIEDFRRKENDAEILELREMILAKESQIATLQDKCNHLETVLQSKEETVNMSEAKLQELSDEVGTLHEQLAQASDKVNQGKEEGDALLVKLEDATKVLQNKELELRQAKESFEAEKSSRDCETETLNLQTESLKEQVSSLSEKLEKVNDVLDVKDQEITSLIQQLKSEAEEKAGLEIKVDELSSQSTTLQEKNKELENRLDQVSGVLKTNQDELSSKCSSLDELQLRSEKEMSELKEQDTAQRNLILQLQEKCSQLEACIECKESELKDLCCKVEACETTAGSEVSRLREELESKENEFKMKSLVVEELTSKFEGKEQQLQNAKKLFSEQNEELKQVLLQKEKLQTEVNDGKSFNESLSKKMEQSEAVVSELKQKLNEREECNTKLKKELDCLANQLSDSLSSEKQAETNVLSMNIRFEEMDAALIELKQKLSNKEEENNSLKNDFEHLANQLKDSQLNEELARSNVESIKSKVEEMKTTVLELKQKVDFKEELINSLRKELDCLDNQLKESVSNQEMKSSSVQELKHNIQTLEAQLMKETGKSGSLVEELKKIQEKMESTVTALEDREGEIAELKESKFATEDKVLKLESQLSDTANSLSTVQNEKIDLEKLLRNAEIKIGEGIMMVEKEKESAHLERSQLLKEKSEECEAALEQLQTRKEEILRLQDTIAQLENVVSSKEQERAKMEESHEVFIDKTQKREEEFMKACKTLEDERSELLQKTRDLEASVEALKLESTVHQQSYRKACELADLKSREYRDMVDKLDDSQKHLQETRHHLGRAENELKESRDELRQAALEKREFAEKVNEKKEELEGALEDLQREICEHKAQISKLSTELRSGDASLKALESEKREIQQLLERTKEELRNAVEKLNVVASENAEREVMVRSNQDSEKLIAELVDQVKLLEGSNAEIQSELDHAKDEIKQLEKNSYSMEEKHRSALAEKDFEFDHKMAAMKEQEIVAVEKMETLMKEKDQKDKELDKSQNLLSARCSQVEKLQRNVHDQTEQLEALKAEITSLSAELDSLKAEHLCCQNNENGSPKLQEQVLELEHLLAREKSNAEEMMKAFQEQEEGWEREKAKMVASLDKRSDTEHAFIVGENDKLKRKVDELQRDLTAKEREHLEALQQTERKASSRANLTSDLQTKIRELECQCDELRYSLKQKDEEIFVKEEGLKQSKQELSNLDSKYAAAAEVERELRHHLGEVTQQLELSKDDKFSERDQVLKLENLTEALSAAEKELEVLRAEKQDKEKWLEDERVQIVEAAKAFAVQQEQNFVRKIDNLNQKLATKNEDVQEMDSVIQQLRYDLKTAQQEKSVLLEEAEERDREFDDEKKKWTSGSFTYEKIQQHIADLEEERQNVTRLQEHCKGLEKRAMELEHANSCLQKNLVEVQSRHKSDGEEREVIEDDLHSRVSLLRSESEKLKETLETRDATVTALSDEKARLLETVKTLEEKLSASVQTVTELQQKCDWMNEKLETLRTEKSVLEKEKDVSVLQKTQGKLNLENFVKKVKELQGKLENEKKAKEEFAKAVNEMEQLVKNEQKCVDSKNKELADMEAMFKLADAESEAAMKEKEGKIVELTFAYEGLRDKLEKERKALEEKCKELENLKRESKQVQERAEEMKEMYEAELDRVKFEIRDSNNDCALLRGENEQLKRTANGSVNPTMWEREKKKLLHQLEEAKIRLNQAKSSQEKLEAELSAANVKVLSVESKRKTAEAEEIKRLQASVSELSKELQKWKDIANNKDKAAVENNENEIKRLQARVTELSHELQKWKNIANKKQLGLNSGKGAEVQELHLQLRKLQEELERAKALADEKQKTADKTLATNLKLASKVEKLEKERKQQSGSLTNSENVVEEKNAQYSWSPPKLPSKTGALTPLARSLASLEIKALNTVAAVTDDTRPGDEVAGVSTGKAIPTMSVAFDSKKRTGEKSALDGNQAKRCRINSGNSDALENPALHLPEGLRDPIKSPFVLRRPNANAGVRTRASTRRSIAARAPTIAQGQKENPLHSHLPPRVQRIPPEMPLSPRKTNRLQTGVPQGPRSKIPKPGTSQLPKPMTAKPKATASSRQAVPRCRVAPGEETKKPTTNQQECKMQ